VLLQTLARTLRLLARRWLNLTAELRELDATLEALTKRLAKRLRAQFGVGPQSAATLLAVAGDNPERLRSEAALAALCGAGQKGCGLAFSPEVLSPFCFDHELLQFGIHRAAR
jgi:transposase